MNTVKDYSDKKRELACIQSKVRRFFSSVKTVQISDSFSAEVHGDVVQIGRSQIAWIDRQEIGALSHRTEQLEADLEWLANSLRAKGLGNLLD